MQVADFQGVELDVIPRGLLCRSLQSHGYETGYWEEIQPLHLVMA
jgi:hypothetical protein